MKSRATLLGLKGICCEKHLSLDEALAFSRWHVLPLTANGSLQKVRDACGFARRVWHMGFYELVTLLPFVFVNRAFK